jgi:hypothetical protein
LRRLCLFSALPSAAVPQLLALMKDKDKKVARYAGYLLQVELGAGTAGTPCILPEGECLGFRV